MLETGCPILENVKLEVNLEAAWKRRRAFICMGSIARFAFGWNARIFSAGAI
jgi:hypothetical protein